VHFRVWAPKRKGVEAVVESGPGAGVYPLAPEPGGYFSGLADGAGPGSLYRYRLDGPDGGGAFPDPASRFQPEGPFGPSRVVDPGSFAWTDGAWAGPDALGQVVYELHVGTFTREGTWAAAMEQLEGLAELGATMLEIMPIADFAGRFGWGYDGVDMFAPTRLYGEPDDFRRFVDRAHSLGLSVILDVVYNHFGPAGMFWREFAEAWFSDRYKNEWGDPINFDGEGCGPVREFFIANAGHWVDEYHLDGLRLDATQQIFDASTPHILLEIGRAVRRAAGSRRTYVVAENEPQDVRLVRPEAPSARAPGFVESKGGGFGLDALWNDDFHHAAMVALTGRREAYYTDYLGSPQEFVSAAKWGFLYQGQVYAWQRQSRGTPTFGLAARNFVHFLENHDQVANSGFGERMHSQATFCRYRAMTALLLLLPQTPMLFQGQEFGSSAPFLYFADHVPELARLVAKGRSEFLAQFPRLALPEMQARLADPADPATFERCKLDPEERAQRSGQGPHAQLYALHRDLLALRRSDPRFAAQDAALLDGAVLGPQAFVLRYLDPDRDMDGGCDDRLLLVNLGPDLGLTVTPEPLLAPPPTGETGRDPTTGPGWAVIWSSEEARYGGSGTPTVYSFGIPADEVPEKPPRFDAGCTVLRLPAESAVVLAPLRPAPPTGRAGNR
jgi:maltooligosyltrehalose trehalohydrolase